MGSRIIVIMSNDEVAHHPMKSGLLFHHLTKIDRFAGRVMSVCAIVRGLIVLLCLALANNMRLT